MAKTFKEIQAEVMELARKNDMDEADAMRLLRSRVKAAGLKMPKGTATDAQAMQQQAEMQSAQMKSQARIQELQAEYQLKDQLDNMQHQRRMEEIALNNSGKKEVASVTGEVKLKSQEKSAVTQSRLIEQKRDRAVPISDDTAQMTGEDLSPENLIEQ